MSMLQKNLPRFLPTLTEVVNPSVALPEPEPESVAASPDSEQIVDRVMRRLDESLEARWRDALAGLVMQQLEAIEPRLRQEVVMVARQAVAEAVAIELDRSKPK